METQRLAFHTGRAHKLALEPEAPTCFLSCGEDGAVRGPPCCDSCGAMPSLAHAPVHRLLPTRPDSSGAVTLFKLLQHLQCTILLCSKFCRRVVSPQHIAMPSHISHQACECNLRPCTAIKHWLPPLSSLANCQL